MKKQTKWVISILLVICIAVFAGAIVLFDKIFPTAKPIDLPASEQIVSVSVYFSRSDVAVPMRARDRDQAMECISEASPTRQQSANDHPDTGDYFRIEIQTADRYYHYYIYEKSNRTYLEIPYQGIYTVDTALLHTVSSYFQESEKKDLGIVRKSAVRYN